jgi:hypothetical protein
LMEFRGIRCGNPLCRVSLELQARLFFLLPLFCQ